MSPHDLRCSGDQQIMDFPFTLRRPFYFENNSRAKNHFPLFEKRQRGEIRAMVNRIFLFIFGLTGFFHSAVSAETTCVDQASRLYGIPANLITAIIRTESAFDAYAININTNGSEDVGLMQINSEWLPRIAGLGYDRASLFDPCINVMVGSWILAQEIERFGYSWEAVGAYHAGPSAQRAGRRAWYAQRVANHLR